MPSPLAPDQSQGSPLAAQNAPKRDDPDDFTARYNTQLPVEQERQFVGWALANDRLRDLYDYDVRGWWAAGAQTDARGHGADTWKKPNHPTFSDQSIYHGVDGFVGGHWQQRGGTLPWTFAPSDTNRRFHSDEELHDYLQKTDPGVQLLERAQPQFFDQPAQQMWQQSVVPAPIRPGYEQMPEGNIEDRRFHDPSSAIGRIVSGVKGEFSEGIRQLREGLFGPPKFPEPTPGSLEEQAGAGKIGKH